MLYILRISEEIKGHFIQPLTHILWLNNVELNILEKFLQIDESKITDKKMGKKGSLAIFLM